jgi:hypothetical protein
MQAPKGGDFDRIVSIVMDAPHCSAFMFNCQLGRGRTTTGMVVATLTHLKRIGATDAVLGGDAASLAGVKAPSWFKEAFQAAVNSQVW